MYTRKSIWVPMLTFLAGAILVANPILADQSIEVPYAAQDVYSIDYGPATQWTDEQGVWHVRGAIYSTHVTGSAGGLPVSGVGVGSLDLNLNLQTGYGDNLVTATYDMTWGDWAGTFQGELHTTYSAGQWIAEWNLPHGTADFAGVKARGTAWGMLGGTTSEAEGVLHLPHGMPDGAPLDGTEPVSWGAIKAVYK